MHWKFNHVFQSYFGLQEARREHETAQSYSEHLSSLSKAAMQPSASMMEFFTLLTSKFPVTLIPVKKNAAKYL